MKFLILTKNDFLEINLNRESIMKIQFMVLGDLVLMIFKDENLFNYLKNKIELRLRFIEIKKRRSLN